MRMKSTNYVSAIIPAFNEERTIRAVIDVLLRHPHIKEVIVVDDGSTDLTVQQIKKLPITVIELKDNEGKAEAMSVGVSAATSDYIFFCDADVVGLTLPIIDTLIEPVLSGRTNMFVGVRDRRIWRLNRIFRFFPILGGERVLSKKLWYAVPRVYKKNFQIEIALNYYAKKMPGKMGVTLMPGVTQIIKEKKYGLIIGFVRRCAMMWDVVVVSVKIYGFGFFR